MLEGTLRFSQSGGLGASCELQVVGSVGNQFVAKGIFDLCVLQEKRTGHALHITGGKQRKIAFEPRHQHAENAFAVEILAQFGAGQTKDFVQLAIGVGKTWQIIQVIGGEKFAGTLFRAQVHKGDLRALEFDLGTKFGKLGDRLATKSSAEMAEEHQQQRAVERESMNGLTGLRAIRLQQLQINAFGLRHCCFHLCRFLPERQIPAR